jgi:hypothetical protein
MAELLIEQQSQEKSRKSDKKRQNFAAKGRGKSAVLPSPADKNFYSNERQGQRDIRQDRSPRFFNRQSSEYTTDHISTFSELQRGIKWSSRSPHKEGGYNNKKYNSMQNFDQGPTDTLDVDFKQQELNRRNRKGSVALSIDDGEDEILDKEYYEFLQTLMD